VIGAGLSLLVLGRGSSILRTLAAVAGAGLLARAVAGHCGVKAAITGQASLGGGLRDQWQRMSGRQSSFADAQEVVEEQADPAAIEEGLAANAASSPTWSPARH
jgi:hypothetical protein